MCLTERINGVKIRMTWLARDFYRPRTNNPRFCLIGLILERRAKRWFVLDNVKWKSEDEIREQSEYIDE